MDTSTRLSLRGLCLNLALFILSVSQLSLGQQFDCQSEGHCKCIRSDGKQINFEPVSNKDGSAAYIDQSGGWTYSWNPCHPLKDCKGYADSAVCQTPYDPMSDFFDIGSISSSEFITTSEDIRLKYTSLAKDGKQRITQIGLVCDEQADINDGKLRYLKEESRIYSFTFSGKAACFNDAVGPTKSPDGNSGWSLGDILLLVTFLLVVLYFAGGLVFNVFYRKLSGIEIVPNSGFWMAVPSLVKDGVLFLVGLVRGNRGGYTEM